MVFQERCWLSEVEYILFNDEQKMLNKYSRTQGSNNGIVIANHNKSPELRTECMNKEKTMKLIKIGIIILVALFFCNARADAQNLIRELKAFEQIVDQEWTGRYDNPNETMEIFLNIEAILNGSAIRKTQTIPDAKYSSETLIYWDPEARAIAFIHITNNGYLSRGYITPKNTVLLYEGTRYGPDGSIRKTMSETILQEDGTFIDKAKAGHTIIYKKK